MGKGSKRRPLLISREAFDENWDSIFSNNKKLSCEEVWEEIKKIGGWTHQIIDDDSFSIHRDGLELVIEVMDNKIKCGEQEASLEDFVKWFKILNLKKEKGKVNGCSKDD